MLTVHLLGGVGRLSSKIFSTLILSLLVVTACSNNDNPIITPSPTTDAPASATGLVIEPGNLTVEVGKTVKVSALLNQNGDIKRDLPTQWSSLSPEILTIDNNGMITALKPGNAQIKAESLGRESLALVTVSPASVTSGAATTPATDTSATTILGDTAAASPELAKLRTIIIRPENEATQPTLFKFSRLQEQRQFVAAGKDSEGQDISNLTFSWSSSDESIAKVNSTGVVEAVATGTTNLIASAGNVTSNIIQIQVQEGTIRAHIKFTE
ncbi:hypothetical protein COW36_12435 [bacterium (Candidatus Blackallbacteria) CG17_big_fil_post_rev_8_21_14_2_50_48_46]|uniref:BIG2 domain-containing protein n=1 Tax=bacterium (Candidatus Blackallbacteria) CG17_big_fil_post_rev_8_21_14_2_50_48_46 TaxID=2014261 RepID=A0A2M7G3V6_9BACT|nr:MAG: hypothetical protein COW64_02825 [bacterium (Candidatus Blackallbacteria) CG18_big_fil_WC_8_21_14_2_50_49_26]PIW16568.1 MAG: hypothetical protein COW36_12435 [bacterium (Candidatus Blackallbacteria) CG17_big_fil_post_rev_8_21_14_2_50_48_46]PIW46076.1 MAG: hypothetical protein COW20_17700 [bacterium (Candidatus Blackallbacteria) CG13_big_fil_rev_8_21_14_2_50_49_14]